MHWSEEQYAAYMAQKPPRMPQEPSTPQGDAQANAMPEGLLLGKVRRLALDHAYLAYHTHDSRRSEYGYPDLTLARPASATSAGRLIFAELKAQKGKATQEQAVWLDVLRHTVPGIEVYLWRPSDLNNIVQILTRK